MLSRAIAGSEILMPLGYCFLTRRAFNLEPSFGLGGPYEFRMVS